MALNSASVSRHESQTEPKLGLDASGNCRVYLSDELHHACLCGEASSFRIAFVKQDCYQDLWIGNSSDSIADLLLSTQLRVGPLGFLSGLAADFHIVQLEKDPTVQLFRSQVSLQEWKIDEIRASRYLLQGIDSNENSAFSHLTSRRHSDYSQLASKIDWGVYHMVVCINSAVSWKLRKNYPDVVWITIPGEGLITYGCLGWDYCITHNCPASPFLKSKFLNIPYTFIRPTEIQEIVQDLGLSAFEKTTIYLEINSCPVGIRPPTLKDSCYAQELQENTGIPVRVHPNSMSGHLQELASSKYFIKTGGRRTRGNSILEAISAGVVVLLRPDDCFGNIELPKESYFHDFDDLLALIDRLESDPQFYNNLLTSQSKFMSGMYYRSISQLSGAYNDNKRLHYGARLYRLSAAILYVLMHNLLRLLKTSYSLIRSIF